MDDAELVRRLRETDPWDSPSVAAECLAEASDRIEALIAERDEARAALDAQEVQIAGLKADKFKMRDERDKAKIAASNYAEFNHTWRARAEKAEAERDAARDAALEEAAKAAEGMANTEANMNKVWRNGCQDAAAAIRAKKGKSHE